MGLDMYFSSNKSFYKHDEKEDKQRKKILKIFPDFPICDNLGYVKVEMEVGYLRKANQIHKWLVDNIQDGEDECQKSYFPEEKIKELKKVCERIILDHKLSETLLPTGKGFFFGNTDYDEYYFDDLKEMISICDNCLKVQKQGWTSYYHSSW